MHDVWHLVDLLFVVGRVLTSGSRLQVRPRRTAPLPQPLDLLPQVSPQLLSPRRLSLLLQRDPWVLLLSLWNRGEGGRGMEYLKYRCKMVIFEVIKITFNLILYCWKCGKIFVGAVYPSLGPGSASVPIFFLCNIMVTGNYLTPFGNNSQI